MDDETIRTAADEHARATVSGDFKVAGSYLTSEARAQAGDVMKAMPGALHGSEVTGVSAGAGEWRVEITYRGESGEAVVESMWADQDGKPMITGLRVL